MWMVAPFVWISRLRLTPAIFFSWPPATQSIVDAGALEIPGAGCEQPCRRGQRKVNRLKIAVREAWFACRCP